MIRLMHVLNRGVDKRKIFLDKKDYFRFVHDLFEFNDQDSVESNNYYFQRKLHQTLDVGHREFKRREIKKRNLLVDILLFCLMPNHYHLFLSERVENGIPLFMQKINGGYTKYFNDKYERSGALFQGKYKRIIVEKEAHFDYLPFYIHANPLDLVMPEWRQGKLKNHKKALEFLNSYRWSSHLDYLDIHNFPSVTSRNLLLDFFGSEKDYKNRFENFLKEISIESIEDKGIFLE